MTPFDAFIESAWTEHGDRPAAVAERLAQSLHRVETPEQLPPYARLLTHVFGEHLGAWAEGIALLQTLGARPGCGDGAAADAVMQGVALLRYAAGERAALDALAPQQRVAVLAGAASALAGRRAFDAALAAHAQALREADGLAVLEAPTVRALAIGGNNLAAALEQRAERDAAQTDAMLAAAASALRHWRQAGGWLEEERAAWLLARCLVKAGRPAAALASAAQCLALCEAHGAPPFERFFGHAVTALAQRAAGDAAAFEAQRGLARLLFEQLAPDEQPACRSALDELDRA